MIHATQEQIAASGMDSPLSYAIASRDATTLQMVESAMARHQVALAFQPVVQADNPGRPAFYEGLIRVFDAGGRIIPARDFIGAVEATEAGRKLDCLALEMGMIALSQEPSLRLSVNMSARSIGYPTWMRTLRRGLSDDPTVGERLILEITECSAMVLPDVTAVFMRDLQQQGIAFALDDFGAGYTAFRHFRDFYFDILKIDGQFIRGIAESTDNQVLATAMLSIARQFDMFTVAECVETAADAEMLAALGVNAMQGYYFGAPTIVPPWTTPAARKAG